MTRSSSSKPTGTSAAGKVVESKTAWRRSFAAGTSSRFGSGGARRSTPPAKCYTADQLVRRVTGKPLSHEPLMRHLRGKFGPLYGV